MNPVTNGLVYILIYIGCTPTGNLTSIFVTTTISLSLYPSDINQPPSTFPTGFSIEPTIHSDLGKLPKQTLNESQISLKPKKKIVAQN